MGASDLIKWANGSVSFGQNETDYDWWTCYWVLLILLSSADDFDAGFAEVLADVIDAMDASEAEEAMGEIVCRTISACAEEGEERGTDSEWTNHHLVIWIMI